MAAPPPAPTMSAEAAYGAPFEGQQAPAQPEPGSYDTLHGETRGLFAASHAFEGARISFSRPVGMHMQLQHQLHLGKENSYHLSPTYVVDVFNSLKSFPIVMGDIDHRGNLVGQVIHEFSRQWRLRLQAQTEQKEFRAVQMELERTGRDYSSAIKAVNVDVLNGNGIFVFNYLQKVTNNLALGGEFMYQFGHMGERAMMTFAGRYKAKDWTATVTALPQGVLEASYKHQYNPQVAVATNLEINLPQQAAAANVGFQYNFRTSAFRGQVATTGQVTGVYEKQLVPGVTFSLSGILDHIKGESIFGVGFSVGQ